LNRASLGIVYDVVDKYSCREGFEIGIAIDVVREEVSDYADVAAVVVDE
jgi:hypothetical protein